MKPKINLISAFIIMICLGSIYAWSIFVPELKSSYGLSTSQTQVIFGTVIVFFTLTMIWAAKLNKKFGPHVVATMSGLTFALGYTLAFLSKGNFIIIWFGVGVLGGIGTGLGYLISLTVPVRWYPEKKGFVTGIVTAGFGGGAILLSYLAEYLLLIEIDVLTIFLIIGVVYGSIIILCAQFLSEPLEFIQAPKMPDWNKLITDKGFIRLFLGIFGGTFAGLLVISNLKPIGLIQKIDEVNLVFGIAIFSLANFLGRLFWGWLSDIINTKILIPIVLIFSGVFSFLIGSLDLTLEFYILLAFAMGFLFGANFVLFANEAIKVYGTNNYGFVYSYVFLGYGIAGILGPVTGGLLFDITGSYLTAVKVSLILCITISVVYFILTIKNVKKNVII